MTALHRRARAIVGLLARRRWAGDGAALLVELAVLVALALAPPSAALGLPAAVAVGIAGTAAVVYGVLDGLLLAFAGALTFAATAGWDAGELAALVVWPAVVAAVGLFARRIERRRRALGYVVTAQEQERKRIALELHDQTAQALASALMTLRAADRLADGAAAAEAATLARDLINETIQALRALAVELSPKALEDYGLAPALERLAATFAERTAVAVQVEATWRGRAAGDVELALFRAVEDALAAAVAEEAKAVRVLLRRDRGSVVAVVEQEGGGDGRAPTIAREAQRERLRLLGGTLDETPLRGGGRRVRAAAPAAAEH